MLKVWLLSTIVVLCLSLEHSTSKNLGSLDTVLFCSSQEIETVVLNVLVMLAVAFTFFSLQSFERLLCDYSCAKTGVALTS